MPGSMVDDFSSAPRSYEGRESAERPLCSGDVELECTISLSVTVDTYGSATITHVNGRSLEPEAAAILLRALNRQALEELAQTELAEVEEAEDEPE